MENELSSIMTAQEARNCIEKINSHLHDIRPLLLDLYNRKGWEVLGYENWRSCVTAEFKQNQSYLYRQLEAAKAEINISPVGEIPERHLRPLTHLPPDQQKEAWQKAVETAPEGKMTARHVEEVVKTMTETPDKSSKEPEDSDALFQLKKWWKRGTKKDQKSFLNWVKNN